MINVLLTTLSESVYVLPLWFFIWTRYVRRRALRHILRQLYGPYVMRQYGTEMEQLLSLEAVRVTGVVLMICSFLQALILGGPAALLIFTAYSMLLLRRVKRTEVLIRSSIQGSA